MEKLRTEGGMGSEVVTHPNFDGGEAVVFCC